MNDDLPKYASTFDVKCPKCGKAEGTFGRNDYRYGSPIRTCKKCGHKYVNRFYHEIAVDGEVPDAFDIKKKLKAMLMLAAFFAAAFIFHWYEMNFSNYYHIAPIVIMIAAIGGEIIFIGDIIFTKTGGKAKRTEKKRMESVQRLQNKEYARELAECGYDIPAEYLGEDYVKQTEERISL